MLKGAKTSVPGWWPWFWGLLPDRLEMKLPQVQRPHPSLVTHKVRIPQAGYPRPGRASVSSLLTVGSVLPSELIVDGGPFSRPQAWPLFISVTSLGKGLVNNKKDEK